MNINTITRKKFNEIWFRTGKDPDGNDMHKIVFGGNEDSYEDYIARKQIQYKQGKETKSHWVTLKDGRKIDLDWNKNTQSKLWNNLTE